MSKKKLRSSRHASAALNPQQQQQSAGDAGAGWRQYHMEVPASATKKTRSDQPAKTRRERRIEAAEQREATHA